jgi:hypothetical protein
MKLYYLSYKKPKDIDLHSCARNIHDMRKIWYESQEKCHTHLFQGTRWFKYVHVGIKSIFLLISLKYTQQKCDLSSKEQHCNVCTKSQATYTLARFETKILCSVGGGDDHYTTPPGPMCIFLLISMRCCINVI